MDLSQLFQQMLVKHREFEVDIEMFTFYTVVSDRLPNIWGCHWEPHGKIQHKGAPLIRPNEVMKKGEYQHKGGLSESRTILLTNTP